VDRLGEGAHDATGGGGVLIGEDDQQEIEVAGFGEPVLDLRGQLHQ
jgi:hypothetical protein